VVIAPPLTEAEILESGAPVEGNWHASITCTGVDPFLGPIAGTAEWSVQLTIEGDVLITLNDDGVEPWDARCSKAGPNEYRNNFDSGLTTNMDILRVISPTQMEYESTAITPGIGAQDTYQTTCTGIWLAE
jgi:hypothetical protein